MERKEFDIAVIGAGPGGYVAAIKAAQEGKKVCLIEKGALGGTCLNVGCIPTKTLLANAAVYQKMTHAADFGIITGPISFDYSKMKTRKDGVVDQIRKGLGGLLQSNGITILQGSAEFYPLEKLRLRGRKMCWSTHIKRSLRPDRSLLISLLSPATTKKSLIPARF